VKYQAIICDIYRTVLHVETPLGDLDARWEELFKQFFRKPPSFGLREFEMACRSEITNLHEKSKNRGIRFPEVQWHRVLGRVLPEFEELPPGAAMDFQVAQQSLFRSTSLSQGAATCLMDWTAADIPLGIASNAQAYTLQELSSALLPLGLTVGIFSQDLSIWSWRLGFSKPDPYFFQTLASRLLARGLEPCHCLMIGDRMDNDILPARAMEFQTWHLHRDGDGDWAELRQAVKKHG
jgi:FMN phosphatase YigB (HAD superfamily)